MDDRAFFWALPALVAAAIAVQLHAGRIRLYKAPKKWQLVERANDEGRFWLFILAEVLLILILIGQAISKS